MVDPSRFAESRPAHRFEPPGHASMRRSQSRLRVDAPSVLLPFAVSLSLVRCLSAVAHQCEWRPEKWMSVAEDALPSGVDITAIVDQRVHCFLEGPCPRQVRLVMLAAKQASC